MRRVLLFALAIVVLLLIFIQSRPDTYHVERSVTIAAPPEAVFARIDDLHRWADWAPWDKYDPNMKKTYEGAASGVGATYHWTGNDKVGEGRMTITESRPPTNLVFSVEFLKPFKAVNNATFALAPEGSGTRVTWAMNGRQNFISKAMCIFVSMDKMVGPDFERGLANLRTVAEGGAPAADSSSAAAH